MDDLTLRLHTEVTIIEDLGAYRPEGTDAPMSYEISVQLACVTGAIDDYTYGSAFGPYTIHSEASRTADPSDIHNVTERALVALADLIGDRMRADRG